MGRALGGEAPVMSISKREGRMGRDEQAGRMHILMGSMEAVRNLGAHDLEGMDQASAMELLGFARDLPETAPDRPETDPDRRELPRAMPWRERRPDLSAQPLVRGHLEVP